MLAQRFLARYCAANGLPLDGKSFSKEGIDLLVGYHWPGNIRELESTVSRAALSSPGRVIRPADIEFLHASETPVEAARERLPSLADAERAHIVRVLESVSVEQEAGGQRARNQPRHAVSEDRRVRAGRNRGDQACRETEQLAPREATLTWPYSDTRIAGCARDVFRYETKCAPVPRTHQRSDRRRAVVANNFVIKALAMYRDKTTSAADGLQRRGSSADPLDDSICLSRSWCVSC